MAQPISFSSHESHWHQTLSFYPFDLQWFPTRFFSKIEHIFSDYLHIYFALDLNQLNRTIPLHLKFYFHNLNLYKVMQNVLLFLMFANHVQKALPVSHQLNLQYNHADEFQM